MYAHIMYACMCTCMSTLVKEHSTNAPHWTFTYKVLSIINGTRGRDGTDLGKDRSGKGSVGRCRAGWGRPGRGMTDSGRAVNGRVGRGTVEQVMVGCRSGCRGRERGKRGGREHRH